jgi:hypothetical protein
MKCLPRIVVLTCLLAWLCFAAFIPPCRAVILNRPATNRQPYRDTIDKNIKRISDSVAQINKVLPVEKIYLHTDKPHYNIGDTIWFKAYVVDAMHSPSKISRILYVQLDDDSAQRIDRISIRIKDGVGWGQIALRKVQYPEGNYTLRAFTTWGQNFGYNYIFSQRLYLSTPAQDTWLVKSNTNITRDDTKTRLNVSLFLNRIDKTLSPIAVKDVEVRVYDDWHYLFSKEMRTGIDGSLKFSSDIKNNVNGRRIRIQITSLDPIDTNKVVQVPLLINRDQKIDLQFLPEGGKLVNGIKSTVAFKALGEDGRGTQVSGGIFDNKGTQVASFTALHNGMGSIQLTPKEKESYIARIEQPAGIIKEYPLPKAVAFGTGIHITNAENEENIRITLAGLNTIAPTGDFCLIGTSRNKLWYSQKIKADQAEILVNKKLFPTGIARFTLFDGITPLNERIVFVDHHDQLSIKITPDKKTYGKHDSVSVAIEVKDKSGFPVEGSFSLSVTDNSQVKADTTGDYGVAASLLINAGLIGDYGIPILEAFKRHNLNDEIEPPGDKVKRPDDQSYEVSFNNLKGEIESPGYYINRPDKQAWEALDNLMLTQGWTDYKWASVFATNKTSWFSAQKNFDVIGKVSSILNSTANIPVVVLSQKPAYNNKTFTDKDGLFVFKDLQSIDSGTFFIQALKKNGKPLTGGEIKIYRFLQALYFPASIKYPILPWYVNSDTTQINLARLTAERDKIKYEGILLKEVKIRDKKVIRGSWNSYGPGNADYIFNEQDIKRSGLTNLYDFLVQNIPGLKSDWVHEIKGRTIAQLKFNNRFVDPNVDGNILEIDTVRTLDDVIEELSKIPLSIIRGIELVHSPKFTKVNDAQPKLIITTYKGDGMPRFFKIGTKTYRPLPLTPGKIFYSPKYRSKVTAPSTDYRATVFWEPNIITDRNGKARISFYTSDTAGGLTLNLQGTGSYGELGSLLYRIPAAVKNK